MPDCKGTLSAGDWDSDAWCSVQGIGAQTHDALSVICVSVRVLRRTVDAIEGAHVVLHFHYIPCSIGLSAGGTASGSQLGHSIRLSAGGTAESGRPVRGKVRPSPASTRDNWYPMKLMARQLVDFAELYNQGGLLARC